MAHWLKKCAILSQTANGYMVELQVITDEVCQWLDKFEEEAVAYLSSSDTQASRELLPPKTPVRQKRTRKRLLKTDIKEDAENLSPPRKSPRKTSNSALLTPESNLKKLSICLTRIDDNDSKDIVSQVKAQTPAKPPRRLKLDLDLNQCSQSTAELTKTDISDSQTAALKEIIDNTHNIKNSVSTPESESKNVEQSNQSAVVVSQLNPKRSSVSRRRSSFSLIRARQSIRRSKRISDKAQRAAAPLDDDDDDNDDNNGSFITEEIVETCDNATTTNTNDSPALVEAASSVDGNPVQVEVAPELHGSDASPDLPVVKMMKQSVQSVLNTTQTIVKHTTSDNCDKDSIDIEPAQNDVESDVDSVISKTPSPVCPSNKVVRPKLTHKPQSSVLRNAKTPILKKSISGGPDSRIKKMQSKASVSGFRTKVKARNSSLASNCSYDLNRLSPKPMTPQQKQEKCLEMIYLREQKSKEVLRQRNETIRKAIEEKKKKRAEKLMKAKMQKEKLEEARLTKIREEEKMLLRKKMQEEAEKKRIAKEKQAEKQAERELEIQRQIEQRQREIEERERLQKEADEKIEKEKQEKVQNVLNTTVTIDKNATNNSSVLENICNESNNYNMTPQPNYPKPNRNLDNYDIDNLNEGDSTDDDEQPRQVIPRWAQGHEFKKAILQQLRAKLDYEEIFPPQELMLVPNLTEIFHARKKKFDKRTSSAVWSSPVWKAV